MAWCYFEKHVSSTSGTSVIKGKLEWDQNSFFGGKGVSNSIHLSIYINIYIFYSEMKCLYCMSLFAPCGK